MSQGSEEPSFEIRGSTLRVCGELGPGEQGVFGKVSQALKETRDKTLVIDLSVVDFMTSSYVRDIALLMVWAKQHDRSVVVRATKRVARLLSMGGIDKLGNVEVVE